MAIAQNPQEVRPALQTLFWTNGNGFQGTTAERERLFLDLINQGLDVNQKGIFVDLVFMMGRETMTLPMFDAMLDAGLDFNQRSHDGRGVLHILVSYASLDDPMVETKANRLMALGVDPNAQNSQGDTPLHTASVNGSKRWIEWLILHGANPGISNHKGQLARDLACTGRTPPGWQFSETPEAIAGFIDTCLQTHLANTLPDANHVHRPGRL
jgi:ankyrin repeat protein